jgi:predicted ATPase
MIQRLKASRFRSLGRDVTVDFGPLTVLVGQNSAGKSNVIDALVFLADCMQIGLEGAVTKRQGIAAIRHGSGGRPFDISLQVEVDRDGTVAHYEVVLTGDRVEEYRVKRECARVNGTQFTVDNGVWAGPADLRPQIQPTALALPALAGDARFASLAHALRSIASYSIFPDVLRAPQKYDPRRPMDRQGQNWVSILKDQPEESWKPDLVAVLNKLTGDVADVKFEQVAGFLVLQFKHERDASAKRKQWFEAAQESDGTLRVAGMITALLQRPRPEVIAIEEPELTVHPGALRLLCDYIKEGAIGGQVVLTTHSPDLLALLSADEVRVVERSGDETQVAPLEDAQREVVTQGLFSLGDVMRAEGLRPKQMELPFPERSPAGDRDKTSTERVPEGDRDKTSTER